MWLPKGNGGKMGGGNGVKMEGGNGLVALAVDKEKGSQHAVKWAADNLLTKGQTVILIHVVHRASKYPSEATGHRGSHAIICDSNNAAASPHRQQLEKQTKDLFLTFHCYCTRKDIQCLDVLLEDTDIIKALTEYISYAAITNLVLGASRHGFIRFKTSNIQSGVTKGVPDFCTVYVISKCKISSVRNACRPPPYLSPLLDHIQRLSNKKNLNASDPRAKRRANRAAFTPRNSDDESVRSPFARGRRGLNAKATHADFSESETDISFVSSGRPSTEPMSPFPYEFPDSGRTSRLSTNSDQTCGSIRLGTKFNDPNLLHNFSSFSNDSSITSSSWSSSQNLEDVEAEMRRLKLELKQTMDMYSTACREALTAKQKAMDLDHWRLEEERKLEEARLAEEASRAIAEKEKARCKAAMESAEVAKRIAELESQRRAYAEIKSLREVEQIRKVLDNLAQSDVKYRRYNIKEIEKATEFFAESRKIGEGGYGPVYRCYLDHTPVAVKVLSADAAQGRSQFQQEIDILSCIRHPNMVLLLGACPEYGILVYEYMANGSLDDRLFRKGNTPVLSWQLRFRIAAEIATGLLFLHQTKPEPLVHRDLKPGNILLDHNYVSKISDVGLARLVPAVSENVTQYHMTSTAGTFCYIDPEYQQTGMLGVKSDVYSLGVMLLQMLTAKPPMGLAHHVDQSIEKGKLAQMLDPAVPDWPVEETLRFAKLAVQCAELRRKDRPDLCNEVLPELCGLREVAEEKMNRDVLGASASPSPIRSHVSMQQDVMSDALLVNSGSTKSRSSTSSLKEENQV
ncbi:U-box domain-containing protein 52 [Alnus glutinosa]|uniref:U-box domain-containing protein 52 n=1 Tax=Alnus glutinosa TaxID=3517 RepID=UPI002D77F33C|nr:U-box domain-containing protein 52 [Alnus glutinosa]